MITDAVISIGVRAAVSGKYVYGSPLKYDDSVVESSVVGEMVTDCVRCTLSRDDH